MAAGCVAVSPATAAQSCQVHSGPQAPTVVELYTSEGCSSCPPADRWLSSLRGRHDVLALAFHVTYWDRLGWPDRFAAAEHTARQQELARRAGALQVYTPQVIVDGGDWRRWPALPSARAAARPVPAVHLQRDGERVTAAIAAVPDRAEGRTFNGYWAVLEDRHISRVRAGENAGATLQHDHVVRLYQPVAAWRADAGTRHVLAVGPGVAEHPRRVAFVVTEAATGRPVHALALAC